MKKKTNIPAGILLLLCLGAAVFFIWSALHTQSILRSTETAADLALQKADDITLSLKNAETLYDNALAAAAEALVPQNIVNETANSETPEETEASLTQAMPKPPFSARAHKLPAMVMSSALTPDTKAKT